MKRNFLSVCIIWLYFFSIDLYAISNEGSTIKTLPMIGFNPHIESITAQIHKKNSSVFDLHGNPILTVGDHVFINSQFCNIPLNSSARSNIPLEQLALFNYQDRDGDNCSNNPIQLSWYILDPKGQNWETIDSWSQLNAVEITNEIFSGAIIPAGILPADGSTPALKIPIEAQGKRIGFKYQPYSETGEPKDGIPLYVWDLNYFFGQNAPDKPGVQDIQYEGLKLGLVDSKLYPAGGVVSAEPEKPRVDNLSIHGVFVPGSRLTVIYDFVQPDSILYEDISRFWWGEKNTTADQAKANNELGSQHPESPILSENDIAKVVEVSILPIGQTDSLIVYGEVKTQTIEDPNNEIRLLPALSELTFYYYATESTSAPEHGVNIGSKIGATYRFIASPIQRDNSTYYWLRDEQPIAGASGNTIASNEESKSATVPAYTIAQADSGAVLSLTVIPTDDSGLAGESMTIHSSVINTPPKITELSLTMNDEVLTEEHQILVNDVLAANYVWQAGTNDTDASTYQWYRGLDKIPEAAGNTEPAVSPEFTGTIPAYQVSTHDIGHSLTLAVVPKDEIGNVGIDVEQSSSAVVSLPTITDLKFKQAEPFYMGDEISATYKFDPGYSTQDGYEADHSFYQWKIGDETIEGTVSSSGVIDEITLLASHIGEYLELYVTPVNGIEQQGNLQSIRSAKKIENPSPSISGLSLSGGLILGNNISPSYSFKPGNGNIDRSTYTWTRNGNNVSTGTVQNNQVNHYVITTSDFGAQIGLKMTPKNERGYSGETVSAQTGTVPQPPRITNLTVYHNGSVLINHAAIRVGDQMTADYTFVPADNNTDSSTYSWGTGGMVLAGGNTIPNGQNGLVPVFYIAQNHIGRVLLLQVRPKDGRGLIGVEVEKVLPTVIE